MKIIVERKHIVEAKKKDSHHCMIADAIKDYLNVQFIIVDTQSIRYSDSATKERYTYLTPPAAQEMILRWDRGIEIQPFAFELKSPIKIQPIRKVWKGKKSVLKKARAKYEMKRKMINSMAPRLVKKNKKVKMTRFREFGVRKFTKKEGEK